MLLRHPKISRHVRIRYPLGFKTGDYSIIDDFCYISTQLQIGSFFHIASNCVIAGGKDSKFHAGDFGSLAAGCKVFCSSDNFREDLATVLPFNDIKNNLIIGDVWLGDYVTIGAGCVIMPGVEIPDGVTIGAMSFVTSKTQFKPWHIYGGYPKLKCLGRRNKENVLKQAIEVKRRIGVI